jgi:phenylalanyl-tRNA synthetase beta chain
MNVSLNILKQFVNLSNISPEEIRDKLTAHTVEVEKIINPQERFNNVVIAKILEVKKHPQADKLQIALVDAGEKEPLKIVCGAPNIAVGQLVPLAKIGAILGEGFEIKKAEIRGEESFGMLCAPDELGLGDDHSGIMILDEKAKIGQDFAKYLNLDNIILEVDNKSLSNRPDLWGHYGLARELSVLFNKKLSNYEVKEIKTKKAKETKNKKSENITVDIKAKNLCRRYLALKVDNVKIEESPAWLKNELSALGINPINNIVDASNYVMIELGQPLHAFDAENIKKISVRKADKGEKFITLDDKERILDDEDLMICSDRESLAIAGIMGGKSSQINNTTSSIIIESANFDAVSVRKTAQRLGIRSDAVMRFEKSLDPNYCDLAIKKMAELVKKLCPQANFNYEILELGDFKNEEQIIALDLNWAEKIIGQKIEDKKIESILESLGLIIKEKKENVLNISIPSWRQKDLKIKQDLIEEIVRIYGYNNININLPESSILPPEQDPEMELIKKIKNILSCSFKMNEVYNYSFVSEEQLDKLELDSKPYIKLLNPLSKQSSLLRQTLTTNLVSNIKTNQAKYEKLALFEIGNIFLNAPGGPNKDEKMSESLPYQEKKLGLILGDKKGQVFTDLKNIAFNLLYDLSQGQEAEFLGSETIINWADKNEKCLIVMGGREIGFLAKIEKNILNKNGIKMEVASCEIDLKTLLLVITKLKNDKYQGISKFPAVNRDLAFVINEKISYNDISKELNNFHELIKKVDLFDVYSGQNLENGKKSLAFHLSFQSEEKTLSGEEVEEIVAKLIKHLEEKFSAQIRNF